MNRVIVLSCYCHTARVDRQRRARVCVSGREWTHTRALSCVYVCVCALSCSFAGLILGSSWHVMTRVYLIWLLTQPAQIMTDNSRAGLQWNYWEMRENWLIRCRAALEWNARGLLFRFLWKKRRRKCYMRTDTSSSADGQIQGSTLMTLTVMQW